MSYELGEGRLVPSIAALIALASVVVGGWALARAGRERAAAGAAAAGIVGAGVGGLHAANAAGGLGTGNGLAGAVVALVLGVIGTAVAGIALMRKRGQGQTIAVSTSPSATRNRPASDEIGPSRSTRAEKPAP